MSFHRLFKKFYATKGIEMCLECKDFIKKGSKILDLGCGCGIAGREFQDFFKADLIGIDIVDKRVEKIPFQIFDGFDIPYPNNSFDDVLISYVLHHAKDPLYLLKEARRVVRSRIILYEDLLEGWFSKLFCKIHSLTFSYFFQDKTGSDNFKKEKEWKDIFERLKLKVIFEKRLSNKAFPVNKKLFVLEKL